MLPYDYQSFNNEIPSMLWNNVLSQYQGDDWIFDCILSDYPATNYSLVFEFAKKDCSPFSITATPSADFHHFNIPAVTTNSYKPGKYYVSAVVIALDTNARKTIGQKEALIKANLANVSDPRTPNRKALDECEEAIRAGAGSDIVEYTIGGRTVKKNRQGLLEMRSYFLKLVKKEEGIGGIQSMYFNL